MQANDMFEYRNAIIDPFKDGNFLSEQLKKLVDAAYDYVLKDLKSTFRQLIQCQKNINSSLFKEFFQSSSPANYVKNLINAKNLDESKITAIEIKDTISNLKDNKRNERKRKKIKVRMKH